MKRLFLLITFVAMAAMNALASETKQMTAPGAYSIDLSRIDEYCAELEQLKKTSTPKISRFTLDWKSIFSLKILMKRCPN